MLLFVSAAPVAVYGSQVLIGAALSTTVGGKLIEHFSYRVSFLALGEIAAASFGLVGLPEMLEGKAG